VTDHPEAPRHVEAHSRVPPDVEAYPRVPLDIEAYIRRVRSACFICELLAGNPDYPHDVAYRGPEAIVFMVKFPWLLGHVLVAPVRHRERVVGDFEADEYLALQRVIHVAGTALTELVPTERLYLLSLGSQQGNRHVHWHLAPLPPGVPYERQQLEALSGERGYLDVPPGVQADLAARLGERMARLLA
jgi:diadenosine tetraphosphate (Ap4A) HIT family hydrolase